MFQKGDLVRLKIKKVADSQTFSDLSLPELIDIEMRMFNERHYWGVRDGDYSIAKAIKLAAKTWGGVKPVVHYSQSRAEEHNDKKIKANAHSDSYWTAVKTYGQDVDVMLECKHKEWGLFKMRELLETKG